MQRTLKKSPKNRGFIPAEACEAGRRVLCLASSTRLASRACAVHYISLPVVVDKVVVVVLKFPIIASVTAKQNVDINFKLCLVCQCVKDEDLVENPTSYDCPFAFSKEGNEIMI